MAQSLVRARAGQTLGVVHMQMGLMALPGSQASTPKKQSNQMSPEYSLLLPSPKAVSSHGALKTFPTQYPIPISPPALHLMSGLPWQKKGLGTLLKRMSTGKVRPGM